VKESLDFGFKKEGTTMYTKVLVPLDGSARAEKILAHVEDLALKYGAAVCLMQVVEPIVSVSSADVFIPETDSFAARMENARIYLDAVKQRLSEKGIDVRARVISGSIVEAICQAAEIEQADLIALASHGRTGAARVFYGSVAAGVLHRIDRPLLIIRARNG
jgi:nucleotide-binding universal stress UspA family protein